MNNTNINPIIGSVVQVVNPYKKNLEDEIDLHVGDQIQVILDDEEYNDGWYYGKNLRTNLIGLFPKCFTESVDDNLKKDSNKPIENGFRKESNNSNQSFYRNNEKRMFSSSSNLSRSHSSFIINNQPSQVRTTSNNSVNRSLSRLNSKNLSSLSVDQDEQDEMLIQQLMKLCDMDAVLEAKNIHSWEPEDVAVYFYNKNIDLDSCLKFYDHKINSKILFSLTQQDLKNELEILSFGSRFSISKEIDNLKSLAEQISDAQSNSGKRFEKSNSFSNKYNEYDHVSSSPSMRSSRRSSLLLPAATVRNRSSSQSTNDSVILNNTNMDTLHNINKLAYNNVEKTPSNKYNTYTDYPNVTRNGTQNYRSTSGNLVPTLSMSKRNTTDSTPVKNGLGLNLNFESPRKPPAPPSVSSPISQQLAGSPDTQHGKIGNIYENLNYNHSGDKIYRNGSSNNGSSNMLKKSTSFLQRNLSFRSTPSRSRNITPSAVTDESGPLHQPKTLNHDKSYQTPQKNERNFDLSLTPKATVQSDADIKPQFLDTSNKIVEPIYQPPANISQDKTNMDTLKDLDDSKDFLIKSNHKKNESGGSFLDLFSKLESMNVNSAVNTPTMPSNHKFLPPTKSSFSQPSTADSAATSVYDNRSTVYEAPGTRFGHTRDTSSVYAHSRNNTIGVNSINQGNTYEMKKATEGLSAGSALGGTDDNSLTNFNEVDESSKEDSFVDFSKDNNDNTLNAISEEPVSKPLHVLKTNLSPTVKSAEKLTAAEKMKEFKAGRAKKVMNYSRTCKESIKTANVHGWMGKRNSKSGVRGLNTWKRRYFVLTGTRLSYYADPDNDVKEKGIIDITGYSVLPVNVSADSNKNERLITFLSSTMSSKSNYFFKIVPPKPGSKKNANFTQQKTYYFSVETVDEIKMWMNAMLKATIDIDTSVPIISSCDIPTISLEEAQSMLEKARKDISFGASQIGSPEALKVTGDEYLQGSEEEKRDISEDKSGRKDSSLDPFKA